MQAVDEDVDDQGGLATSASAATSTRTIVDGCTTYNLSVTAPNTAAAAGQVITVTGSGYNTGQGIYVGLCVVDGAAGANKPTPCLGGQVRHRRHLQRADLRPGHP